MLVSAQPLQSTLTNSIVRDHRLPVQPLSQGPGRTERPSDPEETGVSGEGGAFG